MDDLDPIRGILLALLVGLAFWGTLLGIYFWPREYDCDEPFTAICRAAYEQMHEEGR